MSAAEVAVLLQDLLTVEAFADLQQREVGDSADEHDRHVLVARQVASR